MRLHSLFCHMKSIFSIFLTLLVFNGLSAQPWMNNINSEDTSVTLYDIQSAFESYWDNKPIEKGKGWKQFKRWEEFMEPRVYPTGKFFSPMKAFDEYNSWMQQNGNQINTSAANWQMMGPVQIPSNGGGNGRLTSIVFQPGNSQIIYVGAPAGGLWKSTDYGANWTPLTDNLPTLGVSDIVIDPNNTNIVYIATGDRDGGDTYAVGVMKSTDAGITWNTTGMNWNITQGRTVNRLIMHPGNSNILIAAASNGIWRTTNGGTSWTQTQTSGDHKDMEMNPGSPDTIYATSTNVIRRSVNNGVTWSTVSTISGVNRIELTVTPANPAIVYALCSKSSDNGFHSFRRSTDRGGAWSVMSTTPNIMGWNTTGSDSGGQGWYDLALSVSPTNANWVIMGGVNHYHSTNGGANWVLNAHWYGGGGKPYVHADVHYLTFEPGSSSIVYSANDGGIFRSTNLGTSWTDLTSGLVISMMYGISNNPAVASTVWAGHQDNGTNRLQSGSWSQRIGGDGMWTINSHTNTNTVYGSLYYGDIQRSTNGGTSFSQIAGQGVNGITEQGGWVTPYIQDPNNASILFAGYDRVWRTTNGGTSWTVGYAVSGGSGKLVAMDMSANNSNVVYSAKGNRIWRNTTDISAGLPVSTNSITYIKVDPANENRLWVTFSGFTAANKIFRSTDGGSTWTNITHNLPNLPVNCVEYKAGSVEEIYIGTDVGVYLFDPASTSWTAFNTGLPNVIVRDLKIHVSSGKMRAGTYGRGLWETDLNITPQPPIADFLSSSQSICVGNTITFTDISTNIPTSWSWSFQGGTPATSTSQSPTITYSTPGTYDVTLTVTNPQGSDIETRTQYIVVGTSGALLPLMEDFESGSLNTNGWALDNPDNGITWDIVNTSGNTSGSKSARINNFNYTSVGQRDGLMTKSFDLSSYLSVNLAFKHSYRRTTTSDIDSIRILVSTDCGANFTDIVYARGSQAMATNVITSSDFVPSSTADWCLNGTYDTCYQNIDLSQFIPNAAVVIKFESFTDNGGNVYLDDINITGVINTPPPVADFTASQTLVCPGQPVFFTDLSTSNPNSWVWSFTGGTPGSSSSQNPAVTYNAAGTYAVSLTVTNQAGTDTKNVNGFIIVGGGQSAGINTPTNTVICGSGSVLLNSSNTASSYQWLLNGSPITGATASAHAATASGSYDLVVFDGGCSDTTDISVVITQVPATPAVMSTINGNTSICGTQGLLITGSGGGTYQWLRNGFPLPGGTNNTFTATQPGSYLLVVDNNGCIDTSDNPLVVVLGTMPTANFTFVVNNNTVTFTDASSNGTGWAWDYGDGNNANVQNPGPHSYSALGTFVVTQIVSNGGCSDTVTYQVTISTITSNQGLLSQDAIEVYPNPVGNTLHVNIGDEGGEDVAITLIDATGKVVLSHIVNDGQMHSLNVSTLPKGLYVLRLQVGNRVTDKKLVKE